MSKQTQLTPMMLQYQRIKSELPRDALLLFRLGDFYEMFFDDARGGAQILNVALTKRGSTPMCGIPFHAADSYIARLLRAGMKVAICDQVEEPKPGQLVKRAVTKILSPGTHFDDRLLQAERHNFLAAVSHIGKVFGLASVDLTTASFQATEIENPEALVAELERLRPAELIFPSETPELVALLERTAPCLQPHDDWAFAPETATFALHEHFKVATLDGFGLRDHPAAIGAAGAALHYLTQTLRRDTAHLHSLHYYQPSSFLQLDASTLRHLEVLEPLHADAPKPGSLFQALHNTTTPMGGRRLRDWLSLPLANVDAIQQRQEVIQHFLEEPNILESFRAELAQVRDLERTLGRLSVGNGNARDLQALRLSLSKIPFLRNILSSLQQQSPNNNLINDGEHPPQKSPLLLTLLDQLTELPELESLIEKAIVDEPPLALKEGGIIRSGFDAALDELHQASSDGKNWIARLQQQEIERTGISSLKIRFNSVFGYFIEVTRANLDKVPPEYVRKQTIANGERFITPELKEMEGKILGADERSAKLEYELFLQVRENVITHVPSIQKTADALAQLDVLASFADTARLQNYCRPVIQDEGILDIRDGRHPVLDQSGKGERFVPNDTTLDITKQQVMLITGPNMAGKSTFIRQTALLALLSHTGSFIPASHARIDRVDRIFSRIGASDDLSRGQSTFMVEMSETANILNNATARSLIVLDEIGRGTSTFDGLSLAWSIVEYLHHVVGAKTLFATHYHELTELAGRLPRLQNFNVAVREWKDHIVFLHKILPGGTDKSYGIQVARLAGIPKSVIERSKEILRNLEESELTPEGNVRRAPVTSNTPTRHERRKLQQLGPPPQLDLFSHNS
jgi:DNA mismatch repair protein MutS